MNRILAIALVFLAGCVSSPQRQGGRYVFQSDPPIPGGKLTVGDRVPESFSVRNSQITKSIAGGWIGPVESKVGFSIWRSFHIVAPKKPGVLSVSTNLVDWRNFPVPDNGMNFHLLMFGNAVRTNSVPISVGTPLMIKFSYSTGDRQFFRYLPD